ncbi:cytochrome P450 [Colletotrichum sublineola]|nr:cytochrome P450 [Colletotrichum sublineola]
MSTLDTTETVAFKMALLDSQDASSRLLSVAAVTIAVALFALYQYLLPKPIAGIPYSPSAVKSIFGDIPTMLKESNGKTLRWIVGQGKRWNSPIFQVFIVPFAKPSVVVTDFREAQDILMRRKEFDRSDWTIDLLGGEISSFHINLKTGAEWKVHRRLLQDLMTPAFLNAVAAPNIYTSATNLVDLWSAKARLARGRAFPADQDFYHAALDAVLDFGFGDSYPHRSLTPQIELLTAHETKLAQKTIQAEEDTMEFPIAQSHESIKAILAAGDLIQGIAESGFVKVAWWWKKLQPREKKFMDQRAQFVKEQTYYAIEKLQKNNDEDSESWAKCAVDLIIQRERKFAKKEGREPVYWSSVMKDELLGFIMAGHDTTSTTLSWGVKLLADFQQAQTRLREDLRATHTSALTEHRAPSHSEISTARIPYLDAVIEEILRLSHTTPVMDRQCTQDTVILGHHIPAGTIVLLPNFGPSFTSPAFEIDEAARSETSKQAAKERGVRSWPADDIGVFRPERWLTTDEKTGVESYDATLGPAIPFGLGTRGCFGRKLAYLELKLIVTLIIWNFELLPCAEEISTYEPIEGITSRPKHCYVRLRNVAF